MSHRNKKPKRSTLRLRKFFKMKKLCSKFLVSTIVSNPKDFRYYAKVSFLDVEEYGLIDTGANVSCIGSELASKDYDKFPNFHKVTSSVKTVDGGLQKVCGWLEVNICFKTQIKPIRLLVTPSITQKLILGIDFCKIFNLFPNIIKSTTLLHQSMI